MLLRSTLKVQKDSLRVLEGFIKFNDYFFSFRSLKLNDPGFFENLKCRFPTLKVLFISSLNS